MNLVSFTWRQIRSAPRPAGYEDDLAACASERTADGVTIDVDGDCYLALLAKYRPAERPTSGAEGKADQLASGIARTGPQADAKAVIPPDGSATRRCGCGGRAISS